MGFKLPESFRKEQERKHNLKYITIGDKQIHVNELEDRSVTPELISKMRMNSYAQEDMPPKLTDETLIEKAKYYLTQCHQRVNYPCSTYDEALIHNILPELIKRLEEKQ